MLHMTLLSVALPIWIVKSTRAPVVTVSVLVFVNTVLAVLFQLAASRPVERPGGSLRVWRWSGVALVACCLLLASAAHLGRIAAVAVLCAGVVCLTAGELWQSAAGWEISYRLAPEESRVAYLSVFSLGAGLQEVVGPPLVIGVITFDGTIGWAVLAVIFAGAAVLTGPVLRAADRATVL